MTGSRKKQTSSKSKAKPSTAVAELYEPTPEERAVVDTHLAKRKERAPAPRLTVEDGTVTFDHPEKAVGHVLLLEALGTTDSTFLSGVLDQLINAGSKGSKVDEAKSNFLLSVVKGMEPQDEIEAMLAAQMGAVHVATMNAARRLNCAEYLPQQDSAMNGLNKLARTFAAQVEALKRYRTGGEQKVTVEHVTVNEGGQAIVGNVAQGGRGSEEKTGPTP